MNTQTAQPEQESRNQHQRCDGAQYIDQNLSQDGAEEATDGSARRDISIEHTRLGITVDVGHETPEHRNREQIEYGQPDEEQSAAAVGFLLEQTVEAQQTKDEHAIDDR